MAENRSPRLGMLTTTAACLILVACTDSPAVRQEQESWTVSRLVGVDYRDDSTSIEVEVRHCALPGTETPFPEHKTVSCDASAGRYAAASRGFGGDLRFPLGIADLSGMLTREFGMNIDTGSGEQFPLPVPSPGFIQQVTVKRSYRFVVGRAVARSSRGQERSVPFQIQASCTQEVVKVDTRPCPGASLAPVAATPDGPVQGGGVVAQTDAPVAQTIAANDGPPVAEALSPPEPPTEVALDIPHDAKLKVRLRQRVSSDRVRPGDSFEAELVDDLRLTDTTVLRRGQEVLGFVVGTQPAAEDGRTELALELGTVRLGSGRWLQLETAPIGLKPSSKGQFAARGAGAVGGAVIGWIAGGSRGAAIGAGGGLVGAEAVNAARRRNTTTFEAGKKLDFRVRAARLIEGGDDARLAGLADSWTRTGASSDRSP